MKSRIEYKGGMHFTGMTPSGHELNWDSGPPNSMTSGATPMESLLQAGAVCSAMDVLAILRKRRKDATTFEIDVEGVRAEDHPKVFTNITIVYKVGGSNITRGEVERAVKLSRDKYCSVLNMIQPKVNIDFQIEII